MHPQSKLGVHNWMPADLKAWLDGELSAPRVLLVRAHLLICPACREEVTWLKRLGEDMRDLERAVPSPRLRSRILAALPSTPPGTPAREQRRPIQWSRPAPVFAFAALSVFAAIILTINYNRRAPEGARSIVRSTAPQNFNSQGTPSASGSELVRGHDLPHQTDPYSAEADRRFAQYLRDQENKSSRLLARNRSNWAGFVVAFREERKIAQPSGALTLAVAVPDVNEAEAALTSWAKSAGGGAVTTDTPQPGANVGPVITTNEQSPVSGPGSQVSQERVVALRIPSSKVATLEPLLRKLGAWGPGNTVQLPVIPANGVASRTSSGSGKPGAPANARPDVPVRTSGTPSSITASRNGASDQAMGRDGTPSFLTLSFRLSSLGVAPAP